MAPIRVLVVEDQPKILKNLVKLLAAFTEIEIVAKALSGEEALEIVEEARPEVILLDLGLPGISGIEVTQQVKKRWPKIEILIFTVFEEEDKVMGAIQAGASGYMLKGMDADKIVESIRDVHAGGSVIQPSLARSLLRHFRVREEPAKEEDTPQLTPREIEILQIIAKGLSNSEAAKVLKVSRATIRTHLEHIYSKMSVSNRVEAITEGIRHGIIDV
ncbi:MAG: response regulator transcription factor [Deltaproteobacteria bacterium]|nr:response regulator transcription factor [Deltaproteobacteria bacterium]